MHTHSCTYIYTCIHTNSFKCSVTTVRKKQQQFNSSYDKLRFTFSKNICHLPWHYPNMDVDITNLIQLIQFWAQVLLPRSITATELQQMLIEVITSTANCKHMYVNNRHHLTYTWVCFYTNMLRLRLLLHSGVLILHDLSCTLFDYIICRRTA